MSYRFREIHKNCHDQHLISLNIEHFKAFYDKQTLKFAIPNGLEGSGLTIVVGENNLGKSSILTALSMMADEANLLTQEKHIHDQTRLTLKRCDDAAGLTKIYVKQNKHQIKISPGGFAGTHYIYGLPANRIWGSEFEHEYWARWSGHHEDEYRQYFSDMSRHRGDFRTGDFQFMISKDFAQILFGIYHDKGSLGHFNKLIKRVIPTFNRWYLTEKDGHYVIKYRTVEGSVHDADLLGGGVLSLFKIMAGFFMKYTMEIVIDEPEIGLHPQAQKELAKIFAEKAKEKQIILMTHSPYFIDWNYLMNGGKLVRLYKKPKEKGTKIALLRLPVLKSVAKLTDKIRQPYLLDSVAKEIFFSRRILFVEGQDDMALISKFAKDRNIKLNFEIFGYGTGGATNITRFLSLAKNLKLNAAALFDGDAEGKSELNKCERIYDKMFYLMHHDKDDITNKYEDRKKKILLKVGYLDGSAIPYTPQDNEDMIRILDRFNEYFKY